MDVALVENYMAQFVVEEKPTLVGLRYGIFEPHVRKVVGIGS
jgi:hypothetical protein